MTAFNIADLFELTVDTVPDKPAIVCGDRRLTYRQLDARANRFASFLRRRGVGPGHHFGFHLYNGTEFVEGMLACLKLRAVPINLNYRYTVSELGYLVSNADLVGLVTQRELLPIAAAAGAVDTLVALEDGSGVEVPGGCFDYDEVLASGSPRRDFPPRSGDDLYIIYTGGTTGLPKGVMWRQEDLVFASLQGANPGLDPLTDPAALADRVRDHELALHILPAAPFIHGAAQLAGWICMNTGGKLIIQAGPSFGARKVCELIEGEGATTLLLVGDAMARPVADELASGDYDTDSLLVVASSGAILSASVRDQLQALLPEALVLNNFGSSESGHQGSAYPGSDTGQDGRPSFLMDEDTTVLDDDLRPLSRGDGRIGRIARKGHVPLGYYKDEVKTAERFKTIDGVRWVLPGDFATIEEDGRVTLYGRGSVCINTGGEKVFPEEVEEALKSHPEVFDALVVGVPDPKWMQRVTAVVQPRTGQTPTLDVLQAHCREHIAGYKVPRALLLVERVERQPSGKPDYAWAKRVATDG